MQLFRNKLIRGLSHLIFPDPCLLCDGPKVPGESFICTICHLKLPRELNQDLEACSLASRFWGLIPLKHSFAYLQFKKGSLVQNLMHHMKYRHLPGLAYYLGFCFAAEALLPSKIKFDAIIPVPLHPKKLRIRGYNQSLEIARGIADLCSWPVQPALERYNPQHTQTELNRWHRFENTRSQFRLHQQSDWRNRHILLVDDIVTTGATITGCTEPLIKNGATVSIGTVALSC